MIDHVADGNHLISQSHHHHDPGAFVIPYLFTGFTDATNWKKLGTKCYGFSPLKPPKNTSFKNLFHGYDERIPIDGFNFGLKVLFEVVAKLVT